MSQFTGCFDCQWCKAQIQRQEGSATSEPAMQASKATVDQVLEAIADAILQCVMFQTEAEETGAKVPPT